jgi:hypothetical protein
MTAVNIVLMGGLVYLLAGVVFAIFFLSMGIEKMDASAHGSAFCFRMIIFPGTVALWPVLWYKWRNVKKRNYDKAAS